MGTLNGALIQTDKPDTQIEIEGELKEIGRVKKNKGFKIQKGTRGCYSYSSNQA